MAVQSKIGSSKSKIPSRERSAIGIPAAYFMSCRRSVFQERGDWCRLKSLTTAKRFQLNQQLRFEELSAPFANEGSRSGGGSARRQQIIYQHNLFACLNGVDVHLHFRFAVLKRVTGYLSLEREFATLSNRNEADTELISDR